MFFNTFLYFPLSTMNTCFYHSCYLEEQVFYRDYAGFYKEEQLLYQILEKSAPLKVTGHPGLFVRCQVGYDACSKIADFHFFAMEQDTNMLHHIFGHQLGRELSDFSYVVLQVRGSREQKQERKGESGTGSSPSPLAHLRYIHNTQSYLASQFNLIPIIPPHEQDVQQQRISQ